MTQLAIAAGGILPAEKLNEFERLIGPAPGADGTTAVNHVDLHALVRSHGHLLQRITELVRHAGDAAWCSGCRSPIYWIEHRSGNRAPYDPDGVNHFVTCPEAAKFKGGRRR